MKQRFWKTLVGMMTAMVVLAGCGSSSDMSTSNSMSTGSSSNKGNVQESMMDNGLMMERVENGQAASGSGAADKSQAQESLTDRKLIITVNMSVETKEFDVLLSNLESKVVQLGGYIENLESYNGSAYSSYKSSRNANLTIRIPQNQLDVFLDEVGSISNVLRRSENVQDITLTYVDLESHKRVLETERDRLIELLKQAQELEDILTIESRLTEVRYQLESMEAQLRTYDNRVNYSTVHLNINEVLELTPVVEETTWQRISGGFVDSLEEVGHGLVEFVIWFIVSIPYFVIWGVVITVIVFIIKGLKKIFKSGKKKKNGNKIAESVNVPIQTPKEKK